MVAQIELLKSGQSGQVQEAVIGDLLRATEVDPRDVMQVGEPREDGVGQLTAGIETGDLLIRNSVENFVPLLLLERVSDLHRAVLPLDAVERQIPCLRTAAAADQAPGELRPAREPAEVRDETSDVVE